MKQNTKLISSIENLLEESKLFLEQVNPKDPYGIIIRIHDQGEDNYAIFFKHNNYVLIIPKGNHKRALMYGNWEEALLASKRFLFANLASPNLQVSIGQYSA
jgi:hypothetical protein